ncbi:AP-5 complex subunit mu-1 [Lingula anatina]|uniref:AP-5 complex subunit mu-1 n=1 Tax=Lingula anatina TaxID=7574 RepID=A0A1S3I3B1_LINAN|nr:AP-5 complex subunit mu-1 [Lingula anatina]|eukprot:XP_013392723.1 AP-5 complex subunit mu-1 [Lingula anatina]
MSVRGCWVISVDSGEDGRSTGKTLFSRIFPSVEKRAKLCANSDHYVPLPDTQVFLEDLLNELGIQLTIKKFIGSRDSCKKVDQKPVFGVHTAAGVIWPVLVLEQAGLLYCCVPLVEVVGSSSQVSLIQIPGIAAGYSLLLGIADFVGKPQGEVLSETSSVIADLYLYLSCAAPFGTPQNVQPDIVRTTLQAKNTPVPKDKQPAWRPVAYKGKPNIYFAITEQIKAVQYDSSSIKDVWDLYGTVTCMAELEGIKPEVSVPFTWTDNGQSPTLNKFLFHHSVQSSTIGGSECRLEFFPPPEMFVLCQYTASGIDLPIKGFYQMKGDLFKADLLLQLKLKEHVKNTFQYCFVQLPFYNRGLIVNQDCTASHGSVSVSPSDGRTLVWNVGQKFPSKTLEVSLKAALLFDKAGSISKGLYDDPFCMGQNAYAQVYFKMTEYTQTGSMIEPKTVQVSPAAKVKVTVVREYLASDYKIWNSHGDAQMTFAPTLPS